MLVTQYRVNYVDVDVETVTPFYTLTPLFLEICSFVKVTYCTSPIPSYLPIPRSGSFVKVFLNLI
jgi:hypothetical protein